MNPRRLTRGKPALALADQTAVDKVGRDLSQALAKGVVGRFDSLAELGDHYGLAGSALEKSVSRYNEFQKQRQDPDFAKPVLADSCLWRFGLFMRRESGSRCITPWEVHALMLKRVCYI